MVKLLLHLSKKENMVKITLKERNAIILVEDIVCSRFGTSIDNVLNYNKTKDVSMARNYMLYILHCDFKLSISKLATHFHRSERAIKMQIAIMKVCVNKNNIYKGIYISLMDIIKRGDN